RNAVRYRQNVFQEFVQEMWRAYDMRVVIMVGWKQEDGNTVTAIGDFNDERVNGEKFQGIHKISTAWDKYIATHFEPEGEPNTDDADSKEEPNPTTQVTCEDGAIWIGDLVGSMKKGLQSLVQGFLMACTHPKAVTPFKKLPQFINVMVASEHMPPEFQLSSNPSHMKTSEALHCSNTIRACQKDHPDNVFKFHHWIDENRDLQESMEGKDDTDCQNEDSIEAPSSTSHTEQPTRGKCKGKENDKGKVPAESVVGVRDTGKMQPSEMVAAKSAGRPQLHQEGTAKSKSES
ncbi:hypothetical protein PAXRUDRAFT_155660, partial [Paxillus rubicundulus Ve08.2h10]